MTTDATVSATIAEGLPFTRDPDGFPDPPIRVIDPEAALAGLGLV